MEPDRTVKLLVSDIDGTLVRKDKSLSDGNRAAMRALVADGVGVSLISARPPAGMLWLVAALGITGPVGAFNGGTLVGPDGSIRFRHLLEQADALAMLRLIDRPGVTPWVFADDQWFLIDPGNSHVPRERLASSLEPVIRRDFDDLTGRIDKIVGVSDDSALLADLEVQAKAITEGRATIARSQPYFLDITHRLANKGDGVAALAAAFGVDLEEVAVLGDMPNDLPMFARAGRAVAMGQAPAAVRDAATEVAASNDEDGVADAIARFIRPRIRR